MTKLQINPSIFTKLQNCPLKIDKDNFLTVTISQVSFD